MAIAQKTLVYSSEHKNKDLVEQVTNVISDQAHSLNEMFNLE